MRQRNFLIGALVALVTFVALSAFVGRRHWGWQRGWYYHSYYDNRNHDCDRDDNNRAVPNRHPGHDSTSIQ